MSPALLAAILALPAAAEIVTLPDGSLSMTFDSGAITSSTHDCPADEVAAALDWLLGYAGSPAPFGTKSAVCGCECAATESARLLCMAELAKDREKREAEIRALAARCRAAARTPNP